MAEATIYDPQPGTAEAHAEAQAAKIIADRVFAFRYGDDPGFVGGEHMDLCDELSIKILDELQDKGLMLRPGSRVLGEQQCCYLACDGGACETCPCCSAGYCVFGTDFVTNGLPDTDGWLIWIDVAAEHNPVAKVLHNVLWAAGLGPEDD